ncbi:MAG: hypothetical protein J5830_01325 [Clostridia bacterium]|nr:hypothetical protein [Clostridia bacterium]
MEKNNGIGSLNERALHLALKKYLDPDESHHEIPVGGFIADIKNGNEIIEIETRSFSNLRNKLPVLLKENRVTVVYPVSENTTFVVIGEDGKTVRKGRSTKKGRPTDIFGELMKISGFIGDPGLSFLVLLIDTLEYRVPVSRRGRKSTKRTDRIPTAVNGKIELKGPADVAGLLDIPDGDFTAAGFALHNKLKQYDAWEALKVLEDIGVVTCSKEKRPFLYRKTIDNPAV